MSNKFLLISQVFYPDQVSTANLFTSLCSVIAEKNTEVEVWSAQPSYTGRIRQPAKLIYNGIKIHYLPSTNFSKNNIPGRFINVLSFTISVSIKLLFTRAKTPVWTHTTPPFLGIILSLLCSVKKIKFVYVLLDIFPEGLIRLGKVSRRNPLIRYWNKLFIQTLKRSEKIIVIGRDANQWLNEKFTESASKVNYIPLWQDDRLLYPTNFEVNNFVIENGLSDKFVVQYSGNMGFWNELGTLGDAVRENIKDVVFMFVGGGLRKSELLNKFSMKTQKNVLLLPFQPNLKFNDILNASHVQIVTMKEGLEGIAVPSKIYGILAAGKPVIAMVPENSEIAFIIKEENCGIVLSPNDLTGFINAIKMLKSDQNLLQYFGRNSRIAFEKKYTIRIIAERYQKLLNELN
jgi:colanic acid biosynthesis glycosyl transferase WcaI